MSKAKDKFSYEEIQETMKRYIEASKKADETGDYQKYMIDFFTDDIEWSYYLGPGDPWMYLKGKKDVYDIALGTETAGHKGWSFPPLEPLVIDSRQGIVVHWWDTIPAGAPKREDGSLIHVEGPGANILWYAGNGKFKKRVAIADMAGYRAMFKELMDKKLLDPAFEAHVKEMYERRNNPEWMKKLKGMAQKQNEAKLQARKQ